MKAFLFKISLLILMVACSKEDSHYPVPQNTRTLLSEPENKSENSKMSTTDPQNQFDQNLPLLYPGHPPRMMSEFESVMDDLFPPENPTEQKHFVLFVHGRGRHPKKAQDKHLLEKINSYGVVTLMFVWDSETRGLNFHPVDRAKMAAPQLQELLHRLSRYVDKSPQIHKTTLLLHSMGNIVFKELVENLDTPLRDHLFDNIILSAPDVPSSQHNKWVEKIDFASRVIILSNDKDDVLEWSETLRRGKRLGQIAEPPLARNSDVYYVNISKILKVNHRYYTRRGSKSLYLCQLFETILKGQSPILEIENNISHVTPYPNNKIYWLKHARDDDAICVRSFTMHSKSTTARWPS